MLRVRQAEIILPPADLFNSDVGVIQTGFLGRPQDPDEPHNPGSPRLDPDFASKLLRLVGNDHPVFSPRNGHDGQIIHLYWMGHSLNYLIGDCRYMHLDGQPVSTFEADAIVLDMPPANHILPQLVCRTRGCAAILIYDRKTHRIGAIHLSTSTLYGYKHERADSILHRLTGAPFNFNPSNCVVARGPTIGCADKSCYEFDIEDAEKLFALIEQLFPSVDIERFYSPRKQDGKYDIAFGSLIDATLVAWGVPSAAIDNSAGYCTKCHADRCYCLRGALAQEELDMKYGNLAVIGWQKLYHETEGSVP